MLWYIRVISSERVWARWIILKCYPDASILPNANTQSIWLVRCCMSTTSDERDAWRTKWHAWNIDRARINWTLSLGVRHIRIKITRKYLAAQYIRTSRGPRFGRADVQDVRCTTTVRLGYGRVLRRTNAHIGTPSKIRYCDSTLQPKNVLPVPHTRFGKKNHFHEEVLCDISSPTKVAGPCIWPGMPRGTSRTTT